MRGLCPVVLAALLAAGCSKKDAPPEEGNPFAGEAEPDPAETSPGEEPLLGPRPGAPTRSPGPVRAEAAGYVTRLPFGTELATLPYTWMEAAEVGAAHVEVKIEATQGEEGGGRLQVTFYADGKAGPQGLAGKTFPARYAHLLWNGKSYASATAAPLRLTVERVTESGVEGSVAGSLGLLDYDRSGTPIGDLAITGGRFHARLGPWGAAADAGP